LVVEDDTDVAEAFELLLSGREVAVLHAIDGRTAVAVCAERALPLVIMDWSLHGAPTGTELVRELKRVCPSAAIVVCSGHAHAESQAIEAGAAKWLQKPFTSDALFEIVDEYL
jgi:DNA-binding NtrC family response regulator